MNLMGQDINRQFDADRFNSNLGMQNNNFQANLLNNQLADQYKALGLFNQVGNQQQNLNQVNNDFDFSEFLRQVNYPGQQLGLLGGTVLGMDSGTTTTGSTQQGLAGQLQTGINTYNTANQFFDLFK
jgi:hypothetical protein